jgi:hypothetical protein
VQYEKEEGEEEERGKGHVRVCRVETKRDTKTSRRAKVRRLRELASATIFIQDVS